MQQQWRLSLTLIRHWRARARVCVCVCVYRTVGCCRRCWRWSSSPAATSSTPTPPRPCSRPPSSVFSAPRSSSSSSETAESDQSTRLEENLSCPTAQTGRFNGSFRHRGPLWPHGQKNVRGQKTVQNKCNRFRNQLSKWPYNCHNYGCNTEFLMNCFLQLPAPYKIDSLAASRMPQQCYRNWQFKVDQVQTKSLPIHYPIEIFLNRFSKTQDFPRTWICSF